MKLKPLTFLLLGAGLLFGITAARASFAGDYELTATTAGKTQFLADLHITAAGAVRGASVDFNTYKTARVKGTVKANGTGRIDFGQGIIVVQVKRLGQGLNITGRSKNLKARAITLTGRYAGAGVYAGRTSEPNQNLIIVIGPNLKATAYSNFGPQLNGTVQNTSSPPRLSLQSSDGSFILHGVLQGQKISGNVGAAATLSSFSALKL